MTEPIDDDRVGLRHPTIAGFVRDHGGRLVDADHLAAWIVSRFTGESAAGMMAWLDKVRGEWINDSRTVLFEVPLANLSGTKALEFAQEVSMLRADVMEYLILDGWESAAVRMRWEPIARSSAKSRS